MAAAETSVISRLPLPISSFIGRETELDTLHQILASGARLITLVGPGGVGKTRLALEVCAREATLYPHGTCFVTLEAISEAEYVLPEIARGLSVELSGTATPLEDLVSALTGKRLLLGVDNWEHLIEAAVQIVSLLAACPDLQIIATSREALRLRGEQVFWVEPLLVPAPSSSIKSEAVAEAQAVQLFVERARAVRPGFELDGRNMAAVTEICSLVDGLPLAIELAAALLRLFSPEALLARMHSSGNFAGRSGSVNLLVGGPRDLPARQQTIRSTIAWSYSLLDTEEQSVLRRMAVFADGCDLEAAEAVCGIDVGGERPLLDVMIALVDKSLIRVREIDGEPRFSMLRTIQEFALEKMRGFDELSVVQERHTTYYHDLAARLSAETRGPDRARALECFVRDYDNFRETLHLSIQHQAIDVAMGLCRHLFRVWLASGLLVEGRRSIDLALALPGSVDPPLKAAVLYIASVLALHQGQNESAHAYLLESIASSRESGNTEGLANALIYLGIVELSQDLDLETILNHIHEGIELSRTIDSPTTTIFGLTKAGSALLHHGQYESAIDYAAQSLAVWSTFPESTGPHLMFETWATLGISNGALGHYEKAEEFLHKAISVIQHDGWGVDKLMTYNELGKLAVHRHRFQDAERYLFDNLKMVQDIQSDFAIIDTLEAVACLAQARSASEVAAQLWGACEVARDKFALPRTPHEQAVVEPYIFSTRTTLDEKTFLAAYQRGGAVKLNEAVRFAQNSYPLEANKQTPKPRKATYPTGLTAREVDVLRLVAHGLSDKDVAERLVLSPRTVNAHLTSIYSKLDVNSRVAATRFAIENKLVD